MHTCTYHVYSLRQLECDGSLWTWLHTQAAWDVEGKPGEGACCFKHMKLGAGGVANKCFDVQVSGCVLVREERHLDDIAELVGGRVAVGRGRGRDG